jgi:hypothetical protein
MDTFGNRLIVEIGADVGAQIVLGIALGEDVEGQAFSAIANIGFLGDLEDQFSHAFIFVCRGLAASRHQRSVPLGEFH